MEGEKISAPVEHKETQEVEQLRQEVEKLRLQNEELKKALLSSLDARIYSLLGLCGFSSREEEETEKED